MNCILKNLNGYTFQKFRNINFLHLINAYIILHKFYKVSTFATNFQQQEV